MAQQNIQPERNSPPCLHTSPAPSAPPKESQSRSRCHLTLTTPFPENYSQSSAEHYVLSRSNMLSTPIERQDSSLCTPSSTTGTHLSVLSSPLSHTERMQHWQQEQNTRIFQRQKYRYVYGPPPSSTHTRPSTATLPSPTSSNPPSASTTPQANSTQRPRSFFRKFL